MSHNSENKDLSVAILIVSDTAYKDPSADKSGDILSKVFQNSSNAEWRISAREIVPDAPHLIQRWLKKAAGECNLIITTGGTGFATKDVTPEAVEVLLDKKAPGLVHGMLAASLKVTPFAMMARPVAGVYKGSIIVTLPGSPKGAKENLEAILPLLPHACMQAAGTDSRTLHAGGVGKLEKDAGVGPGASQEHGSSYIWASSSSSGHQHEQASQGGHSHGHSHGHGHGHMHGHTIPIPHTKPEERPQQSNDPLLGPSRRYRESPYPMLAVEEAVRAVIGNVPAPKVVSKAVMPSLCYHIIAEDVTAREAVPAFRASIVDGYAITISPGVSSKGTFEVASVSHAAPGSTGPLAAGKVSRITTGAPLPPNATSVVMVEDTVLKSATADGDEELEIDILTNEIKPGENVRDVGSDVALGDIIIKAGETISPTGGELGLLASVGVREVKVYERPTIGVMSTGDEIVPPDQEGPLQLGEVRDTNRTTLLAAFRAWGFPVVDLDIGSDNADALEQGLRTAFGRCDVLVTTGGASMGERDLLKPVLERRLGATVHFGRVAMKPGKPTTFCTVDVKDPATGQPVRKPVFSLPGNPASAVVTAAVFALPGINAMAGQLTVLGESNADPVRRASLPRARVVLRKMVRCDPAREEYVRAGVTVGADGRLAALTTGGQRSSRVGSLARANGLLILPAGGGEVPEGETVDCLLLGQVGGM